MSEIVRIIFLISITVMAWMIQLDTQTLSSSMTFLKEDIDVAVHDASVAIDETKLSQGVLSFDEDQAIDNFEQSLERNSGLVRGDDYEIIFFETFDHESHDFPHTFEDDVSGVSEIVSSPTVIAGIRTSSDSYYEGTSEDRKLSRMASYSYEMTEPLPEFDLGDYIDNVQQSESGFYWSVPYTDNITSNYGTRTHPVTGEVDNFHSGIDIAQDGIGGEPAISAYDGTVVYADRLGNYGNVVVVDHGDGLETRYAHLNSIAVNVGDEIEGSNVVGTIGSTGRSTAPHLHFEMRVNGDPINPMSMY